MVYEPGIVVSMCLPQCADCRRRLTKQEAAEWEFCTTCQEKYSLTEQHERQGP